MVSYLQSPLWLLYGDNGLLETTGRQEGKRGGLAGGCDQRGAEVVERSDEILPPAYSDKALKGS